MFVDSHCHLSFPELRERLPQILADMREAKVAAALWIEAATKSGKPLPQASATLERLSGIADVVKLSAVATMAGMSPQTLASKIKRGTPLTEDEEKRLGRVLLAYGLRA